MLKDLFVTCWYIRIESYPWRSQSICQKAELYFHFSFLARRFKRYAVLFNNVFSLKTDKAGTRMGLMKINCPLWKKSCLSICAPFGVKVLQQFFSQKSVSLEKIALRLDKLVKLGQQSSLHCTILVLLMPLSYNGVYFHRFILNCKLDQFQREHSF